LRHAHRISRVAHAAQQNRKLVAAETRQRIDRAERSFQTFSKRYQQQVAVRVAQAVVDASG
jgi:hypothetical protein